MLEWKLVDKWDFQMVNMLEREMDSMMDHHLVDVMVELMMTQKDGM